MSKLNPQKASAYVGPGVLRRGGKITPVPNGPLIKKKGPFKGSTLKAGGKIKKAKAGASTTTTKTTEPIGVKFFKEGKNYKAQVTKNVGGRNATYEATSPNMNFAKELANDKALTRPADSLRTAKKNGGMLKRADGSYSKRGLWDNLRSKAAQNKKTGAKPKSPTKAMLTQEKKIKAKAKK
jgi:hypothetical protein